MIIQRSLAIASLLISFSTAVYADTKLSIQHTEPGEESRTQSLMIAKGKVRMEQGGEDDDTILLYHQASNTFYAVQPGQKTYIELDPEKTGEMIDQASQMRQQMMAQLQEQMAEMPEEQRQQMMEMMKRSGQQMPGMPEEPVRYERNGGSDRVGGFACNWVEAHQGDRKVRELCLAAPSSMGMATGDRDTMLAMQKSMQAMAKRLGNTAMFQDDMPDGFPVHVRHFDSGGRVTSEQIVQGVSQDSIDASIFEVPAGFKKQELPTMPPR